MTIAETLQPKLAKWSPAEPGRTNFSQKLEGTNWALALTADRVDTLGCLIWEAMLIRSGGDDIALPELKKRATQAADRATGLIEPLRVVEFDEVLGVAQIRSDSPTKRTSALAYYDVQYGNRLIAIRRYEWSEELESRVQIAFALTHEAIAKLVDDLVRV